MKTVQQWQFWVDRGGTFTDVVALSPQQQLHTLKLLSHNPEHYDDAIIEGLRRFLKIPANLKLPISKIASVKIGTTVATNALLERKGAKTIWLTTKGFKDALAISYQNRKNLFSLTQQPYQGLYSKIIEVEQRMDAQGRVIQALQLETLLPQLQLYLNQGYDSLAVSFCHALKNPQHEIEIGHAVKELGFKNISLSHQCSSIERFVSRSSTTVADAYLSPVLKGYIDSVLKQFDQPEALNIEFMQSHGGLCKPQHFGAKNAVLSGPAGGVVGMVKTAQQEGYEALIGFDMGGTSTDVCHYLTDYEYTQEAEIDDFFLAVPMLSVHTVAAGGGSIISFDGQRLRVGPESAGAVPGPSCYRLGGPLTVTDCHVLLGRINKDFFPKVFGEHANQTIDINAVKRDFAQLKQAVNHSLDKCFEAEDIAEGCLDIAAETMAEAIKKITIQKGHDTTNYTLCSFGGAGGQVACKVAEKLEIKRIFFHSCSGVLSALGMGLAERKIIKSSLIKQVVDQIEEALLKEEIQSLKLLILQDLDLEQNTHTQTKIKALMHYKGSNTQLSINFECLESLKESFIRAHQQEFGFVSDDVVILDSLQLELIPIEQTIAVEQLDFSKVSQTQNTIDTSYVHHKMFVDGQWVNSVLYQKQQLNVGQTIVGPAIIIESTATIVVEPHWELTLTKAGHLELIHKPVKKALQYSDQIDPIRLEIFNHLFMALAEQMGAVLEKTATSVNIKERKDFSCALFDAQGSLVANAPHVPVHLGSMSDSVLALIKKCEGQFKRGDAYILNNPYAGGTHLPDVTVIMPLFVEQGKAPVAYVASRGHHADIGGITPGSMPAYSTHINEEGVLFDNDKLLEKGVLKLNFLRMKLSSGQYPARNLDQNIEDLKAQVAACMRGQSVFNQLVQTYELVTLNLYMRAIQDNAMQAIKSLIPSLQSGHYRYENDDGIVINCAVTIQPLDTIKPVIIDFTGSSAQLNDSNWNAPKAITTAAVLYVFRCLIDDEIPLNQGCLNLLEIKLPKASVLNPTYPAAVVAGNVETSQLIVDSLFAALGICAASQGTMNNLIFGNEQYQYYETIAGGSGGSIKGKGIDAKQTHMTNSRMTDIEVLEQRFPVLLEEYSIRKNSGGQGLFRGGHGVVRRFQFLQDMQVNIISGQRSCAPHGLSGGENGLKGVNMLIDKNLKTTLFSGKCMVKVLKGQKIQLKTPSGGGFGKK